jgi:phosphoglucosamine mutase
MAMERIFGTDGIRGHAGEGWLDEDRVSALGRAIGKIHLPHLHSESGKRPAALLGHDGRASGPVLQAALARGLSKSGFEVKSTGLISTPGLAWLTRHDHFALGAMLSASHNQATDNGIKVFSSLGEKLSDEEEIEIEGLLRSELEPERDGPEPPVDLSLEAEYVDYLSEHAAEGLALDGVELVVDCANGSGSHYAPTVLERLGAKVQALFCSPDGTNINDGCGSTHPEVLQREVVTRGAMLGIALDGDADRCILVDERGELVHGDGIMTIIARQAVARERWSERRIVATVMSNRGLHRALREVGIGVVGVGVGDRQVVEALRREGLPLGGEQSGHIIFGTDNHFIGDGLYTALRVLRVLRETGSPISELAAAYQPYPQILLNVPVSSRPDLITLPGIDELIEEVQEELGDDGRVLLRYSGTEPLARVMVEGPDREMIETRAQRIAEVITAEIGA